MGKLELKTFVSGDLFNNSYLIFDKELKKGFIVDSPAPSGELDNFIQRNNLEILFIALTHAHFDHIEGLSKQKIPFYVHKKDAPLLEDCRLNGSSFLAFPIAVKKEANFYPDNNSLRFENFIIKVIHTPGHTPGSVSLKLNNWLFSGDTLFCNSIGRTDIPLASEKTLIKSIKEKILALPDDTVVYPGHGPSTTVGNEKVNNLFLLDFRS